MYALIEKSRLAVVTRFQDLAGLLEEHKAPPYVVINLNADDKFAPFSHLELKILYNNLGYYPKTDLQNRAGLEKAISALIGFKPLVSPAQLGVFDHTDFGAVQGSTRGDRPVANGTGTAPRTGIKAVVWDVADRLWNEAGSPKAVDVVLVLRRKIMDELEGQHGIKRTTSSTALGEWQKVRLNNL